MMEAREGRGGRGDGEVKRGEKEEERKQKMTKQLQTTSNLIDLVKTVGLHYIIRTISVNERMTK